MNFIIGLAVLCVMGALQVECQPEADSRENYFPYFFEMLNPSFRHHRARLRPYASQMGSPIVNIRGTRSVTDEPEEEDENTRAECIYGDDSIYCTGINKLGKEIKVKCDATLDFQNVDLSEVKQFAVSELRMLSTEDDVLTKMYLYPQSLTNGTWMDYRMRDTKTQQRNTFSVHSLVDKKKITDRGVAVMEGKCWNEIIRFFKDMKNVEEIEVNKVSMSNKIYKETVKVIANLSVM